MSQTQPANDLSVLGRIAQDPVAGKLNHNHLQALGYIVAHDGTATPGAVADACRITRAAGSRIVDRLVEEHLVARKRDTKDTRVVFLSTTPAGRRLHQRIVDMLHV